MCLSEYICQVVLGLLYHATTLANEINVVEPRRELKLSKWNVEGLNEVRLANEAFIVFA